jgi:SAM-dependent methyltransferase
VSSVVGEADNWDEHWAGFSESAKSNPAQYYRHDLLADMIRRSSPRLVLDIGSGQGDLLELLSKRVPDASLAGLELSQVGTELTRAKVPDADVRQVDLINSEARLRLEGIRADLAVCCEVLEHLDDPVSFLRAASAALAPGATLLVTVPGGPRSQFDKLIGHRRHYSPVELRTLLEEAGFEAVRVDGSGFPFFNLYRLTVIVRGKRLADDVGGAGLSGVASFVMRAFGWLFKFNLRRGRLGWQTVGVARWNAADTLP